MQRNNKCDFKSEWSEDKKIMKDQWNQGLFKHKQLWQTLGYISQKKEESQVSEKQMLKETIQQITWRSNELLGNIFKMYFMLWVSFDCSGLLFMFILFSAFTWDISISGKNVIVISMGTVLTL